MGGQIQYRVDYEGKLPKSTERVVYETDNCTTISKAKPYNELVEALRHYGATSPAGSRATKQMAWFLGMNGHPQVCKAMMETVPLFKSPLKGAY